MTSCSGSRWWDCPQRPCSSTWCGPQLLLVLVAHTDCQTLGTAPLSLSSAAVLVCCMLAQPSQRQSTQAQESAAFAKVTEVSARVDASHRLPLDPRRKPQPVCRRKAWQTTCGGAPSLFSHRQSRREQQGRQQASCALEEQATERPSPAGCTWWLPRRVTSLQACSMRCAAPSSSAFEGAGITRQVQDRCSVLTESQAPLTSSASCRLASPTTQAA